MATTANYFAFIKKKNPKGDKLRQLSLGLSMRSRLSPWRYKNWYRFYFLNSVKIYWLCDKHQMNEVDRGCKPIFLLFNMTAVTNIYIYYFPASFHCFLVLCKLEK